jgi:hypothetical protein
MRATAWNDSAEDAFGLSKLRNYEFNSARYLFLDEGARTLYRNWTEVATDVTAQLRLDSGRYPNDADLTTLIGDLTIRSPVFSALWASNTVRPKKRGHTVIAHPEVGDLDLSYQTLLFPDDPRTSLIIYTFQAASPTEERYRLLRSLHASGGGHTGVHANGALA